MEKTEIFKAFGYAEILWNTFKREKGEKEPMQIRLWYDFLKPYDLDLIYASMRELAKESDFCNVAKIARGCQDLIRLTSNERNENEIFIEIDKAIDYYSAKEKFEKLSPIAKRVVVDPAQLGRWACCEINEFNTVVASQIRRAIRVELERENKKISAGIGDKPLIGYENKNILEKF